MPRLKKLLLTDSIFEIGAYEVPSKSQNPTIWVKVVHLVPNIHTLAGHAFGAIYLAPTTTLVHKTKYLFLHWIFLFFANIRLEIKLAMWCQSTPSDNKLPNLKLINLLKKFININLLFFNNNFLS